MSQKDLVQILQQGGWNSVYQNTVSRIEKGDRPVRYGEAMAIAHAFGESVEKFSLAPAESLIALHLSVARQRHSRAAVAMAASRAELEASSAELEEAIQEARRAGVEPTELPDNDDLILVPVTVEDELALALEELGE